MKDSEPIRPLLTGGDRRSIASSKYVHELVERDPSRVDELAALVQDQDWLVTQRALDLLEKLAHAHLDWIAPHKQIFIGPLAESEQWEIRLQIVRALPLFEWTPAERRRVQAILISNLSFPQTFVRAWALDGLARIAASHPKVKRTIWTHVRAFERSSSKALQARARHIRLRLANSAPVTAPIDGGSARRVQPTKRRRLAHAPGRRRRER
jgi:hypothetical protein